MSSSTMARASVCGLEVPWMGPSSNTKQSSVHSLFPFAKSPGQPLLFSSISLSIITARPSLVDCPRHRTAIKLYPATYSLSDIIDTLFPPKTPHPPLRHGRPARLHDKVSPEKSLRRAATHPIHPRPFPKNALPPSATVSLGGVGVPYGWHHDAPDSLLRAAQLVDEDRPFRDALPRCRTCAHPRQQAAFRDNLARSYRHLAPWRTSLVLIRDWWSRTRPPTKCRWKNSTHAGEWSRVPNWIRASRPGEHL